MINSYTIPAIKLNWFAFLRAFYRRSLSQTKPTVECFFNFMEDNIISPKKYRDWTQSHWMWKTRIFGIWTGMLNRCRNEKLVLYRIYGGRWISVCDRWKKFENFLEDMWPSYFEHREKHWKQNTTLDRKDSDWNYEPSNCRWATCSEQARNKNTLERYDFEWERLLLVEIAERIWLKYATLRKRIKYYGWSFEKAVSTPLINPYLKK